MVSRRALGFLAALTILFIGLASTAALAAGGSAADSQYQDPLAATHGASKHHVAAPVTRTATSPGSVSLTVVIIGAVVLIGLLAGGGLVVRRRAAH